MELREIVLIELLGWQKEEAEEYISALKMRLHNKIGLIYYKIDENPVKGLTTDFHYPIIRICYGLKPLSALRQEIMDILKNQMPGKWQKYADILEVYAGWLPSEWGFKILQIPAVK